MKPAGDLRGQALLDLQVAGEQLHDATELAQADDPIPGEIADVRHPVEGQQVMHAQRVKRDRPRDDQLVISVLVGKRRRPEWLRGEQLGVGVGHPARRLAQRLVIDVRAERPQELPSRPLDSRVIDLANRGVAWGGRCQRESGTTMMVRGHVPR